MQRQTMRFHRNSGWMSIVGVNSQGQEKLFVFCPMTINPSSYPHGMIKSGIDYASELLNGHRVEEDCTIGVPFSGDLPPVDNLQALEMIRKNLGNDQDAIEIFGENNCVELVRAIADDLQEGMGAGSAFQMEKAGQGVALTTPAIP